MGLYRAGQAEQCRHARTPASRGTHVMPQLREILSRLTMNAAKKHLFAPNLCNASIRRNDVIDLYK
jgi:hypothetical protein